MRNCTLSILVLTLGVMLVGCGGSGAQSVSSLANSSNTANPMKDGVEDGSRIVGKASNVNAATKTFSVTVSSGTFPLNSLVNVTTNSSTRYRNANGIDVSATTFFTLLINGKRVEVEGAKTGTTSLLATKAKIQS